MRLKSADLYLTLLMLAIAFFSAYKLFLDKYQWSVANDQNYLAKIAGQVNTVKRKSSSFLSWLDADPGDKLAVNDQVYTYKNSQADVWFDDGQKVSLVENTLFRITERTDGKGLDVEKGMMYIGLDENTPDLEITLDGRKFKVSSKNAKIQISKEISKNKITILEGELELKAEDQVAKLKKNQYLEVDKQTGKRTVHDLKIIPLLPKTNTYLWYLNKATVTFKWNPVGNPKQMRLQISNDRDFKNIIREVNVSGGSETVSGLFEGGHYWRVLAYDEQKKKNVSSGIRNFTLMEEFAPRITTPYSGEEIVFKKTLKQKQGGSLSLHWDPNGCQGYKLQVTSPGGQTKSFATDKSSINLKNVALGNWRFRVKGEDKSRPFTPWSEWVNFKVSEIDLPPAPALTGPRHDMDLTIYRQEESSIQLTWNPIPGVTNYKVTIKKDGQVLDEAEVGESYLNYNVPAAGTYSWSVKALDDLGRDTPSSPERRFSLNFEIDNALLPEDGSRVELKRPNQKVKFEWEKVESAPKYLLEISDTRNFQNPRYTKEVQSTNVEITFSKIGTYYWRTKILKNDGAIDYSRPFKVEVRQAPPPERPTIERFQKLEIKVKELPHQSSFWDWLFSPAHARDFVRFTTLDWEGSEDAKKYVLEVYEDRNLQRRLFRVETEEPYYEWVNPRPGRYYWRIAIVDHWDRQTEFSNVATAEVDLADDLKSIDAPTQILPQHKTLVNLDKEKRITFSWKGDERTEKYRLVIARTLKFKRVLYSKITTDTEVTLPTSKFRLRGRIYWRVEAHGKYGQFTKSRRRRLVLYRKRTKKEQQPQLAKVITPKSKLKAPKLKVAPTYKSLLAFAFAPTKVSYEQTDSNFSATIDGTAINSIDIRYQTWLNTKWQAHLRASRHSGKVFDTLGYSVLSLEANGMRQSKWGFNFMAGVAMQNVANYTLGSGATTLSDKSSSLFAALVGIQKELSKGSLWAQGGFGSMTLLRAGGEYRHMWKKKTYFSGGLEYNSRSYEDGSAEVSHSEIKVLLGVGHFFGKR